MEKKPLIQRPVAASCSDDVRREFQHSVYLLLSAQLFLMTATAIVFNISLYKEVIHQNNYDRIVLLISGTWSIALHVHSEFRFSLQALAWVAPVDAIFFTSLGSVFEQTALLKACALAFTLVAGQMIATRDRSDKAILLRIFTSAILFGCGFTLVSALSTWVELVIAVLGAFLFLIITIVGTQNAMQFLLSEDYMRIGHLNIFYWIMLVGLYCFSEELVGVISTQEVVEPDLL